MTDFVDEVSKEDLAPLGAARQEGFEEGQKQANASLDYFSVVALERIAVALEKHLIVTCAQRMRSMSENYEELLDKVLLPVLLSHRENKHFAGETQMEEPEDEPTE